MSDGRPVKAKLWLEGLRAFRRHGRAWLPSAAVFFLIYAAVGFIAFDKLQPLWQALPKLMPADNHQRMKLFTPLFVHGLGWLVLAELILVVQYYLYVVFFSRRELAAGQPVLSAGRFFYGCAKALQMALIFLAIGAVFGLAIVGVRYGMGVDEAGRKVILLIVRMAAQVAVLYTAIRYYFVYVLAVNKMRPVLRTSWKMTHGNWWRLFWNKLVLDFFAILFLAATFVVAGLVAWLLQMLMHKPLATAINPLCIPVMIALTMVFCAGVFAAFSCVACRILYEEKRQSDTSFALTTRA